MYGKTQEYSSGKNCVNESFLLFATVWCTCIISVWQFGEWETKDSFANFSKNHFTVQIFAEKLMNWGFFCAKVVPNTKYSRLFEFSLVQVEKTKLKIEA